MKNATIYVTGSVNWSSTTIFTQFGRQRLFKVGNVCDLHLFFNVNSAIVNGAVICGLPGGFAPSGSITNYATWAVNSDGTSTILPVDIANNGQITTRSAFNGGFVELNIRYVVKN